jgi:hypothetical protein
MPKQILDQLVKNLNILTTNKMVDRRAWTENVIK